MFTYFKTSATGWSSFVHLWSPCVPGLFLFSWFSRLLPKQRNPGVLSKFCCSLNCPAFFPSSCVFWVLASSSDTRLILRPTAQRAGVKLVCTEQYFSDVLLILLLMSVWIHRLQFIDSYTVLFLTLWLTLNSCSGLSILSRPLPPQPWWQSIKILYHLREVAEHLCLGFPILTKDSARYMRILSSIHCHLMCLPSLKTGCKVLRC